MAVVINENILSSQVEFVSVKTMRQLKITKSITNRESASLDKYLQEIGREDLITVEEEVELAQKIEVALKGVRYDCNEIEEHLKKIFNDKI